MANEIDPLPPFRLAPTVRVLQRRPNNAVEVFEQGHYYRVLHRAGGPVLVRVVQTSGLERPRLAIDIIAGSPLGAEEIVATVRRMLGVDVDVGGFYLKALDHPRLSAVAQTVLGLKPPRFATLFEAIVNAVLFQQISLSAAVAIANRLSERFSVALYVADRRFLGTPAPETIASTSMQELRAVGMSERKAATLRELARMIARGELAIEQLDRLSSAAAIAELVRLPGIGRWTAQVILLRGLGRLDVFPSGDVGVRRGLARLIGEDQPLDAAREQALLDYFREQRGMLYFFSLACHLLREGVLRPSD